MKLRTRFLTLLAFAAAALTGCRQEEADMDLPAIQVGGPDLHFDPETKKASCAVDKNLTTLQLTLTANRPWSADITWDMDETPWMAVTPDSGEASDTPQRVTVTILNNAGYNRSKQLKFTIGYDYKSIAFSQTGERGEEVIGTLDNPLTVAGAVKYVKKLGADVHSSSGVYVKGKVSRIDDGNNFASSGTYGNATFYISDDGSDTSEQFYCYRVLYLGNKKWTSKDPDIQVGDDVIIYGHVVNYKGNTPETVQGTAFIYDHNGVNRGTDESGGGGGGSTVPPSGSGTASDPFNVSGACDAVKNLTWTSTTDYQMTDVLYVKGKISRIADNGTFGQSGTYGNATFYISDDGTQSGEFYCYRILYFDKKKYTSGTDIQVGDEVVVAGKFMNYRGNTPETVASEAWLYSLNGEGGSGGGGDTPGPGVDPAGTGTQADPYNVAAALNAVKGFTWTSNDVYDKTGTVYVKGKISRIADNGTFGQSGTYGNATFYISDDGKEANELYCYRILYLGNVKYTSGTDIKVGDEVIVCGELMNYRGNTPETVANAAYLYSLNSSGGGGGGDTPGGDIKPMTIAAYLAEPVSTTQWYELTGTVSNIVNTTYGNFDLTDASGKVYVYGLCATKVDKNDKSFASLEIQEGDNITIITLRSEFNGSPQAGGNTPAYLKSKNSGGGGGGGGDTPAGTVENPYTVAQALDAVKDLTWTSNTDYQATDDVYVKGKISRIASGGTYTEGGTYGNASFYISDDGTETAEFYCFRILYLENKKFEAGQTDIQVGDEVVICGKLMNYRGNTPETVSGQAYLYSLKSSGSGGGGGDTPGGTVSFATNSDAQTWAADADGTYGNGFSTTTEGLKIGFYKHTSTSTLIAPTANHVRIYKNAVLSIAPTDGKKIKRIVIQCAPNAGTSSYCFDMSGLEGGASATADKTALTTTWNGSAAKVVLQANNGQVRMEKLTVEFE